MDNELIDRMRAARQAPAVALQEYNNLRSKIPGKPIFSFEGFEDTIFYGVMAEKFGLDLDYGILVCRGKDRVLGLRDLLARNKSSNADRVWYFIDHDFDGFKGSGSSNNTYCTKTYSFENNIIGEATLISILKGEFRCAGVDGLKEIERALDFYSTVMRKYINSFRSVNLAIFALRNKRIDAGSIEADFKKYASISIDGYDCKLNPEALLKLVGAEKSLTSSQLSSIMNELETEFREIDPITGWRGKFHLVVFQKILSALKEDRGRKQERKIFSERALVDASFDGNIVRMLSSLAKLPSDLAEFFSEIVTYNEAHLPTSSH